MQFDIYNYENSSDNDSGHVLTWDGKKSYSLPIVAVIHFLGILMMN